MGLMFSNLIAAYTANLLWAVPLTIAAILASFMLWMKYTNDLWWTDFWVVFPVIGKMRKWTQDVHDLRTPEAWAKEGMPAAEQQLCSTYLDSSAKKHPIATEKEFNNAQEYLKITHQAGTTPTSVWMWLVLIILTVAEAAGTGLLIAPFVASEITGNQMVWIGYVIALVMAAGLLGLTHFAGNQVNKWGTIRNHLGNIGRAHDELITDSIDCGDDQSKDARIEGKDHAQIVKIRFANRALDGAHDRGSLVWVFVVVALLAALLSGITWMRVEGIKIQMTKQTAEQTQSGASSSANPFAGIPGMPGVSVPESVNNQADSTNKAVHSELDHEQFSQGLAGAVVLALIYLITQGLGFLHALKHSFVGTGRKAFDLTRGETSYKGYESRYVMPWINKAQKRLEQLRTRLKESTEYRKAPSTMTCLDYFHRQQSERDQPTPSQVARVASIPEVNSVAKVSSVQNVPVINDDEIILMAKKILRNPDPDARQRMITDLAGSKDEEDRILKAIEKLDS